MDNDLDFIGTPTYFNGSGTRKTTNNFRVKTDESFACRVLPPFGLLAKTGRWASYEASHWGYTTSTGQKRSFRCIFHKNRKTGMVEQECPECTKIAEVTRARDLKKRELETKHKSRDEIEEALEPVNGWLFTHNLNRSFKLNVLSEDGRIGRLFLKIKHKQALDGLITDLMEGKVVKNKTIDPIDPSTGVWFNFTKKGSGAQAQFLVAPVYEDFEVQGVSAQRIKSGALTETILRRMKTEATELSLGPTDLTFDQISRLVQSGGDPAIVDQVFGTPTTESNTDFPPADEEEAVRSSESTLKGFVDKMNKDPSADDFKRLFGG